MRVFPAVVRRRCASGHNGDEEADSRRNSLEDNDQVESHSLGVNLSVISKVCIILFFVDNLALTWRPYVI
jgi:hypothetical protein